MHTHSDRQIVHILNVGTRRCPSGRPVETGQIIVRRQEGRSVCRRQDMAGQRCCIQALIQEVHADIERLGEVVLQTGAN